MRFISELLLLLAVGLVLLAAAMDIISQAGIEPCQK